jgi:hypothetical protein
VQVHERKDLGDLGALAAPRRHDGRAEAASLAGLGVDSAVVDPRRLDLDAASRGGDGAWLGVAVSHDQAVTVLVELAGECIDVAGDLSFQGGEEHPPGSFPDDLIERGGGLVRSSVVVGDYCQYWRSFLAGVSPPANLVLVNEEGTPRLRTGGRSTGSGYKRPWACHHP